MKERNSEKRFLLTDSLMASFAIFGLIRTFRCRKEGQALIRFPAKLKSWLRIQEKGMDLRCLGALRKSNPILQLHQKTHPFSRSRKAIALMNSWEDEWADGWTRGMNCVNGERMGGRERERTKRCVCYLFNAPFPVVSPTTIEN